MARRCPDRREGERLFFKTKTDAETKRINSRERVNQGISGVRFPDKLRVEALECEQILKAILGHVAGGSRLFRPTRAARRRREKRR